jgi:hypothetical protein
LAALFKQRPVVGTGLQWVQAAVVASQQWFQTAVVASQQWVQTAVGASLLCGQTEVVACFLCDQTAVGASLLAMGVACGLCSGAQRAKTRQQTLICGNQAWMFEGLNLRFDFAQVGHVGLRIQ